MKVTNEIDNIDKEDAPRPLLLNCSPRKNGNSYWASINSKNIIKEETGAVPEHLNLIDFKIKPCIGCELCKNKLFERDGQIQNKSKHFLGCHLSASDTSQKILQKIISAPALYLFSPIYHYHLPAHFKALIDRLQPFYWASSDDKYKTKLMDKTKPCFTVLLAGRPRGEKLFAGSLLSLKYSLAPLDYNLEESLLLRGIDAPSDFSKNSEAKLKLMNYIKKSISVV